MTPELAALQDRVQDVALEFGLQFPEVVFELIPPDKLNMVASYEGFPVRYPHWRFGMQFQNLHKSYQFGLSKIYELVINTDPCYAYLLTTNTMVEQKLVMAHVYGHADFFHNNMWFAPTNRKMIDVMANHGTRIRRHVDRQGLVKVERFLDACLSLENLIDPMSLYMKRHAPEEPLPEVDEERIAAQQVTRFPVERPYMEPYVNPKEVLQAEKERLTEDLASRRLRPSQSSRDVLEFLLHNAPLADWQADCLDIVREEAYYFAPQRMTKILNEGWATYVHSQLMTKKLLKSGEILEYASKHAATVSASPGQVNPYRLGFELYHDVEDRWNRGAHGKEWRECTDWDRKHHWDTGAMEGRQKIFDVRRTHNDLTALDAYLTPEFIESQKLYSYGRDPRTGQRVILDRDPKSVKAKMLAQFTNMGQPVIEVADANHENRGELYLVHRWAEAGLREDFARDTLRNLFTIWTRPVHIETRVDDKRVVWSHDGTEDRTRELGGEEPEPQPEE